ncbi:MAG: hypothetical protein AAF497_00470, partial [Planctomycetota bacterium]
MKSRKRSRSRKSLNRQANRKNAIQARKPLMEVLEDRRLLAADAMLDQSSAADPVVTLQLSGDVLSYENLYVRESNDLLQWSSDGTNFTTDFDSDASGDQTVSLSGLDSLTIDVKLNTETDAQAATLFANLFDDTLSTLFVGDLHTDGADLSISGLDIELERGSLISTRNVAAGGAANDGSVGSSGSVSLDAPFIDVKGTILANSTDASFNSGDVSMVADGVLDDITSGLVLLPGLGGIPLPDITITQATINLDSAIVRGRDITIDVESDSSDLFADEESPGAWGEPIQEWVGSLSLGAGVAISEATASLDISGGILNGRNITLNADAESDAEAQVLSVYAAVAYGQSIPKATIDVTDGAQILARGDLDVDTRVGSDLGIFATQNLIGTSSTVEKYNITLNGAYSNLVSTAKFSSDSTISVGSDFNLDTNASKNHNLGSFAAAYGDGTLATAINVGVHESTIEAHLDGTVDVGGDMNVHAELETEKNDYTAQATVGSSDAVLGLQQRKIGGAVFRGFTSAFSSIFKTGNALQSKSINDFDVAASLTVGIALNNVDVRIGDDANVTVGGSLTMRSIAEEFPETSAISFFNVAGAQYRDFFDGPISGREKAYAGAVSGSYFANDVDITIGDNATVVVGGDMTLEANASVPYYFQYIWDAKNNTWENFLTPAVLTDRMNFNLGIQNGFFTSWAEAIAAADEEAIGLMFNVMITDSHNNVTIGRGADVTVSGDMVILAESVNDTINFVGSPLIKYNATPGKGIGAATMVTGYINETVANIESDASISANSLLVFANNRGRNISIGVQGGFSDGPGGFNGAFNGRFVKNRTLAKISPSASLNLGSGQVAVPLSFDSLGDSTTSVTTSTPLFNPVERYVAEDDSILRVDASENSIALPYAHGLSTGSAVYYDNQGGDDIDGLSSGTTYYAIVEDGNEIGLKLASSYNNAIAGTEIPLGLTGLGGATDQYHSLYPGFDPSAADAISGNEITLPYAHNLVTGQAIKYGVGDGTEISGLTPDTTYYAIVTGENSFKLASTSGKAIDVDTTGDETDVITLSSTGTGVGHSFVPVAFTEARVLDTLRALDSNDDGDVTTADEFVIGFNIDSVTSGPAVRSVQTNQNLLLIAEDDTESFSGTGAVTKTLSSAGSLSVSADIIVRDTQAFIGDEQSLLDDQPFTPGMGVHSSDLIVLDYAHGFSVGDTLTYTAGGDSPIGGLQDRGLYVVTEADGNNFRIGRAQGEATASFAASDVDDGYGLWTIDLGYDHGFHTGDAVVYELSDTDTGVGGLTPGQVYYVIPTGAQTIALTESLEAAVSQDLYDFTPYADVADNLINFGYEHSLEDGQALLYRSGGGQAVGGLEDGDIVFVDLMSDEASSIGLVDADGNVIELDPTQATGIGHTFQPGFDISADLTTSAADPTLDNTIDLGFEHGWATGDPLRYDAAGSANTPAGITDGALYYAIEIDEMTIALAATEADAEAGRERFFATFDLERNDATTAADKFDTVNVYTEHGYSAGDQLVYIQNGSADVGLTDGETYTVQLLDASVTDSVAKIQLLDSNGDLVELTQSTTDDFGSLINLSVRRDLTVTAATSDYQFLRKDQRVAIDATSATGTSHSIRLSLDSSLTSKSQHGFGIGFDPSTALSDADSDEADDTIDLGYDHGFSSGQAVTYSAGQGRAIAGLNEGQVYYVRLVSGSTTKIQLTESVDQAREVTDSPEVVQIDGSDATNTTHVIASVFRPVTPVDVDTNEINFGQMHGYEDGDLIRYDASGGTEIGGLTDGTVYEVIYVDSDRIQLSEVSSDPAEAIDLDPIVATGTDHRFVESSSSTSATIETQGNVGVLSVNTGQIISVTVAGTIANSNKTNKYTGARYAQFSEKDAPVEKLAGGTSWSGTAAINVVVDTTRSYIQGVDLTSGGGVYLDAVNDVEIFMGAGAITYAKVDTSIAFAGGQLASGSSGAAGSLVVNVIVSNTEGFIESSTVDAAGPVAIDSDSMGVVVGVGFSGSGAAGGFSLAGAIAVNVVAMDTLAEITDSTVESDSNVDVDAKNIATILAAAGSISTTLDSENFNSTSSTSFGAGIAINVISNDLGDGGTIARIEDSQVDAGGNLDLDSETIATIGALAAGFAINTEGNVTTKNAVAGSLAANIISTKTNTIIRGRKNGNGVTVGGDTEMHADDSSLIVNIGGALAWSDNDNGNSNSAGISFAFNTITTDVRAQVDDTTLATDSVIMDTTTDGTIYSLSVAAAGADDIAVAGQVTANWTEQSSIATITNSTVTASAADITLDADNASTLLSISGGAALGDSNGGTAVGAAISFNITNDETIASIDSSTVTASDGDVSLDALSDATIITVTVGIASGKQIGVGGSISTNVISNETRASVADSTVSADRNLTLLAEQNGDLSGFSGALGYGRAAAGVGGTLTISVVENDTLAYIDNSTVEALANDNDTVTIKDWDADGNETTETISGVSVIATNSEIMNMISAAIGASKDGAGVAVNLAPTFLYDTTHAYIQDTNVNSDLDHGGDVIVRSHQDTDFLTVAGSIALGGLKSVGIAAEGIFVGNDTQSWISDTDSSDEQKAVYSGTGVETTTHTSLEIDSGVVGVALSKTAFSGAGSVDFMLIDNNNQAYISGMTVNSDGSLEVSARDNVNLLRAVGGLAGSQGVGAAAAVLAVVNDSLTEARILNSITNATTETL